MKTTIRIRVFLEKWRGVHLRRNCATLSHFFEREEQDLEI
jgi:hypothetical protein